MNMRVKGAIQDWPTLKWDGKFARFVSRMDSIRYTAKVGQ